MISDDNTAAGKRKGVRIEPLHTDVPVAATPTVSHPTNDNDLQHIRETIDALQDEQADTAAQDVQKIILQQQTAHSPAPASPKKSTHSTAAASLIRRKIARLYAKEPDAVDEAIESFQVVANRSKHQQYMHDLSTSGRSLADIQTAWHAYYVGLSDAEKHEVWQEFYSAHSAGTTTLPHTSQHAAGHVHHGAVHHTQLGTTPPVEQKTVAELKSRVMKKVNAEGKLSARHHLQSLLFGLGMASIVAILFLFSFFNERFIAPFMSPSRQVTATPIVGNGTTVGPEPKIVIPKINLEVPVVYDLGSTDEKTVQAGLENGVVHYSTSPTAGQTGNTVIVGHSSNNILNKGKYKFAFVLLKRLEVGDTFSLHKDGVRYTYQIFEKKVVKPTDVTVLGPSTKPNTATLITCDPPGTSVNRLIIVGEQISPDPSGNKTVEQKTPELTDKGVLPSNAPSLWQRIKNIF